MTVTISTNANEMIADFERAGYRATRRAAATVQEGAIDLREEWRSNARQTARRHGKRYPRSIDHEMIDMLMARIGPRAEMAQAGMSWEFGSRNQPPHLDGQRAVDDLAPRLARRFASILVF